MMGSLPANMIQPVVFILALGFPVFATGSEKVENVDLGINLVLPESESKVNAKVCRIDDIQAFSRKYHECFVDKKYQDGGRDLEKLAVRILEHSKDCVENSTRECKPNLKGFVAMMDHVIYQMKDYSHIYLEHISKERYKIEDLQCVEHLSVSTYQGCFKDAFLEMADSSSNKFQQKVEGAISCTSKLQDSCSRSAKTNLNRMVRQILGVDQPQKENIQEEPPNEKQEPAKRWYDAILQPFIGMWRSIRSFFGF